jgi:hypothetical protein
MNFVVNLFVHRDELSVKDRKSNLRGCHLTDRSRHSSFHFILPHFTWILPGTKEGRSVVAARSPQLLVGNTVLLLLVILKAFLLSCFTLLDSNPEEMFKISKFRLSK